MTQYFIRRFLLVIPTFIGITILVFMVTRFVPGGPIERMIAEAQQASAETAVRTGSGVGAATLDEDQIKQLEEYYGFDKPVLVSYWQWLKKVVQLDLGLSTRYSDPVWDTIKERLPVSAFYGIMTMLITYLISIPLGYYKAIKHNSHFDHISSVLVFIGYAIPAYVVGIILLVVFASNLEWFPMGGFYGEEFEDMDSWWEKTKDIFYHAALPLTAYVVGSFAVMTFMMKNSLMDNLAADYVRTAIAKGIPFRQAVRRHALRNSLIPLATHFGNNISFIIAGSFLIEKIFNIDGLGLLGYESIIERDYPIVLGVLVISSLLQLFGNILSDVCVAMVDPRVQFK
ncbi:MAG TPA: peptide ABC transporter permease [Gammaproteobacteria bacterium]|nr:peptide ABC transporter permease [Gammaproteobacteria bacterium]